MTRNDWPPMQLTNWHEIERRERQRLGPVAFEYRVAYAHHVARLIADDRTWFVEDRDREGVFTFMAWRLQSLAVQLTTFDKFQSKDHDTLGIAVCRMMESGTLI